MENNEVYGRLVFLADYFKELEHQHTIGNVTEADYRHEKRWISNELGILEDIVFPEVKRLRESPEMALMRKEAETFFDYWEGVTHGL